MGLDGCRYVIHTDVPEDFYEAQKLLEGVCEVEVRQIKSSTHNRYRTMTEAHLDAIKGSEAILFLPPDSVVSTNLRKEIETSGKKLVMVCSLRTLNGFNPPEDPVELNKWSVDHLHPGNRGWIWGNPIGTELVHAHVYFDDGFNFWAHCFHLHPVAAILDRKTGSGKSIDSFLPGAYPEDETWVVRNSEIAMATIDPPDLYSGLDRGKETVNSIVSTLSGKLKAHHKKFFKVPIRLKGSLGSSEIPGEILKSL